MQLLLVLFVWFLSSGDNSFYLARQLNCFHFFFNSVINLPTLQGSSQELYLLHLHRSLIKWHKMKKKNAYFTLCPLWVMAVLYSSPIQMSDLSTEFKHPLPSWRNHISLSLSPCSLFLHKYTDFCARGRRAGCYLCYTGWVLSGGKTA